MAPAFGASRRVANGKEIAALHVSGGNVLRAQPLPNGDNDEPVDRNAAVDFRQLRYFVTVAEELHFGRAARSLYITQPALSQAIARLEASLGVPLLTRSRHHVELTPAGAELLACGRQLLAYRDETIERVQSVANGTAGILRLGVAALAEHEITPALTSLEAAEPGLLLDRVSAVSERLLAQLRDGRLDAAFVHQVPALMSTPGVSWEVVRTGTIAALVGASHHLASSASVSLEQLRGETFLVNPRELAPSAYEGMKLMCQQYGGFEPRLLESTPSSTFGPGCRLIQDGGAVALMAEDAARSAAASRAATADLIRVIPVAPPPQYVLALAWRRGNSSPLLERFLDHVRAFREQHGWTSQP
jgi:DNA-binding transcriptional LysR family regulator